MPIYKFKCAKCGSVKEVVQKFNDKDPKHCRRKMSRLLGRVGFHLKGTGWSKDGYR